MKKKKPPSSHLHSPNPNRQLAIRFLQLNPKGFKIRGAPAGHKDGERQGLRKRGRKVGDGTLGGGGRRAEPVVCGGVTGQEQGGGVAAESAN